MKPKLLSQAEEAHPDLAPAFSHSLHPPGPWLSAPARPTALFPGPDSFKSSLTSKLLTFWGQIILYCGWGGGAVLCVIGCVAASLIYPLHASSAPPSPPHTTPQYGPMLPGVQTRKTGEEFGQFSAFLEKSNFYFWCHQPS